MLYELGLQRLLSDSPTHRLVAYHCAPELSTIVLYCCYDMVFHLVQLWQSRLGENNTKSGGLAIFERIEVLYNALYKSTLLYFLLFRIYYCSYC